MRRREARLALAASLLLAACGRQVDVVAYAVSARDAGSVRDGGSSRDGGSGQSCAYRTREGGDAGTLSLDALLAQNVTRAICTCGDLATSSSIMTRTGSGVSDGGVASSQGGGVGVNVNMSLGAASEIGGSLVVAGPSGISLAGPSPIELRVDGELAVAGPLQGFPGSVTVLGNAAVGDRIELGALDIMGSLTQPSGASNHVTGTNHVGGDTRMAAIKVQPPCACDAASTVNVGAFADFAKQKINLASGEAAQLDQSCGEYALGSHAGASLKLEVHAPAALYVAGDLHLDGDLVIDTFAGAELDLFVAGNLKIDGVLRAGDPTSSGRVRIFVADPGTLPIGGGTLRGLLYVPAGEIVVSGALTIYGALAAGRISASAPITVAFEAP